MTTPWPPIDYTVRDFSAFRNSLIEAAEERVPEWTSRSPSDFAMVMIELMSYVGDNLSFYGDRIANEAFLQTATRRQSVLNIANMLDYIPSFGAAAKVAMRFEVFEDAGEVLIPACTQVSTADPDDPVIFELDEDLVITADPATAGSNVGTVNATEGVKVDRELLGVSPGGPNQYYYLSQSPVVQGTITITVDTGDGPREWREISHLIEARGNDPVFTTEETETRSLIVIFGDDVNGRAPLVGAHIVASYRIGGGDRGNVPAATITELLNDVPGVADVTNPEAATGGADPEKLSEIRVNAPRALTTLQRAVTVKDHANLALRKPFVGRAGAVRNADVGGQVSITVHAAPAGGGVLSVDHTAELEEYLDARTMINYLVGVAPPTYVPVDITVEVSIDPAYDEAKVKRALEDAIERILAFRNVDFGFRVRLASIYQAITSTGGVEYGVVTNLTRTGAPAGVADVQTTESEIPEVGTITIVTT